MRIVPFGASARMKTLEAPAQSDAAHLSLPPESRRGEEMESHIAQALRLSPRDTMAYLWMTYAGHANLHLGKSEHAVAWFRRGIEANRNYQLQFFQSGAALAQLGQLDEAHSAVKAGLAINPAFTISRDRAVWTATSDDPTYLARLESILEGTRKAGVPEQ
jgi:tetratricopeptide (TPR) repeat protein